MVILKGWTDPKNPTWVVHRLTEPVVPACEPEAGSFEPDPGAEERLQQVVDYLDPVRVVRLPVLHELGARYPDDEVVEETQGSCGPWGGH